MTADSTPALVKQADADTDGPAPAAAPAARGPRARNTKAYLKYVAAKIFGAVVSLFAVLVTSFFLFRLIPSDPVKQMTGGRRVSAEQLESLRHQFGLDQPMWQQFTSYVGDALTGDFGTSFQYHAPVMDKIIEALPATLLLTGTAYVLFSALGIWLGTRTAWRNGSNSDRFNTALALTLYSVPSFWLGLLLIIVFAVGVGPIPGMFPTGGLSSTDGATGFAHIMDVAHHMVLPVITLVAVGYAQTLLVMRSSLLDEMGSDYLTTARAKGLRDDVVRRRHAVPNAMLPTFTLMFVNLGHVVAGQILVETVFSWPGLGGLFYSALSVPDLPLVQGLFFVFATAVILANTLADLLYPLLDPRVGR
ncbi:MULTISPECIES: ABC transporter permease [unclassified Streptomyces]|uniref:ABC transporter permease n=1 Tax=unclassified Streptomyces TaxID=2593676 RepID=UPI002250312C|nr:MULTISPECIES: ABC transporter permease [unclassified Streptomyces]MCX5143307.1 ABC transporter permease [Streptomyces sp. NBC_00338]WRZ67727.1 ABC transporter permease [Streptomyces sp. NBC_01257]WSU61715.1 ABC transporter permease [Streptomyces sp. NBC_01104]